MSNTDTLSRQILLTHPQDSVVIALEDLPEGTELKLEGFPKILTLVAVPRGHKIALKDHSEGDNVYRYGFSIGCATTEIKAGEWVHSHNLKTLLSDTQSYHYQPNNSPDLAQYDQELPKHFMGYKRRNGTVGTRNELWIINTVACVNRSAERIARTAEKLYGDRVDGIHTFSHPYGCSQLGDDLEYTQKVLAGLINHPNAGAVLIMGLGCENNQIDQLMQYVNKEKERVQFFYAQAVDDEIEEGLNAVESLLHLMAEDERSLRPISDLVIGMKCGGSDGLSGITANPLLGQITDQLCALGGTALLTEVPEMFGAEQVLMNRAKDREVFDGIVELINNFKNYFIAHQQPVYENPSPGNKDGGITTLEEKSLGAIQKGGTATVCDVLKYGERVRKTGLNLIEAPGNDGVSCTAESVAGATLLLFTTGRGTPLGFPVPTLKISTNTALAQKKKRWIDFDAGAIATQPEQRMRVVKALWEKIIAVASGSELSLNELNDYREIAIWKDGVTL